MVSQRYRFGLTTNVRFSKSLGKLHVLCPLDETNNNNPKRKGESSRGCVEIFTILANQKDSVTISKQAESIKLDPLLSSKPWTLSWAALLVALFPDVLRGRKTHRICGQVKRVRVQMIECEGQVRLPLVGQFQSVVCLLRTLNQQDLKVFPRPETWFTAALYTLGRDRRAREREWERREEKRREEKRREEKGRRKREGSLKGQKKK